MPDVAGVASNTAEKAGGFFGKIVDLMVPLVAFIGWNIYKQAFKEIVVVIVIIGLWYVSGTHYMQTLIVNGELQIGKILPVMFGGAALLGIVIYMYFGRS